MPAMTLSEYRRANIERQSLLDRIKYREANGMVVSHELRVRVKNLTTLLLVKPRERVKAGRA